MRNGFFWRMARRNLSANQEVYLPFTIAMLLIVCLFNLLASLVNNPFILHRSAPLVIMVRMGSIVIAVFSAIFVFYTVSFLSKRRQKELALYAVLGMENGHMARMLFLETVLVAIFSIGGGLLLAALLGNLVFMVLNWLMRLPVTMDFVLSIEVELITIALFALLFSIAYIMQVVQLSRTSPAELLREGQAGQREPKTKILRTLLAFSALIAGYGLSLTTTDPLRAIDIIVVAVLLVMFATYDLFTFGSIFVLKVLRRNRAFYYRPQHFIAVSGMLYRMKQNATGLANITILITMVTIVLAVTLTVFLGVEHALTNGFPRENQLIMSWPQQRSDVTTGDPAQASAAMKTGMAQAIAQIRQDTEAQGFHITQDDQVRFFSLYGKLVDGEFIPAQVITYKELPQGLLLFSLADFNQAAGTTLSLAGGEALIYMPEQQTFGSTLRLAKRSYQVKPLDPVLIEDSFLHVIKRDEFGENIIIVVPEETDLTAIRQQILQSGSYWKNNIEYQMYFWETDVPQDQLIPNAQRIRDANLTPDGSPVYNYSSRSLSRQDWYEIDGGFLFIGIFLGLTFMISAILLTYFKQVSEGYDDRRQFQIMQKVGLEDKVIRQTTNSQLVWMFFLPLGIAILHTAFAYPIISKLLLLFGITDPRYFLVSVLVLVLAVSIIYSLVYRWTSRIYYAIVH